MCVGQRLVVAAVGCRDGTNQIGNPRRGRFALRGSDALIPHTIARLSRYYFSDRHLTIPASGVFQSGTRQVAFVDRGGGYFEPREVETGDRA